MLKHQRGYSEVILGDSLDFDNKAERNSHAQRYSPSSRIQNLKLRYNQQRMFTHQDKMTTIERERIIQLILEFKEMKEIAMNEQENTELSVSSGKEQELVNEIEGLGEQNMEKAAEDSFHSIVEFNNDMKKLAVSAF